MYFILALNFHFWPFFKISKAVFETSVVSFSRSSLLYSLNLNEKYYLFFPMVELATKWVPASILLMDTFDTLQTEKRRAFWVIKLGQPLKVDVELYELPCGKNSAPKLLMMLSNCWRLVQCSL